MRVLVCLLPDTSCKAGHGMACHHMGLLMLYSKEGGYNVPQVEPQRVARSDTLPIILTQTSRAVQSQ